VWLLERIVNVTLVLSFVQELGLQHFILYAHGPDLCHDLNIKHALANCFEAVMGMYGKSYELNFVDFSVLCTLQQTSSEQ